jgi:hypothetical protein
MTVIIYQRACVPAWVKRFPGLMAGELFFRYAVLWRKILSRFGTFRILEKDSRFCDKGNPLFSPQSAHIAIPTRNKSSYSRPNFQQKRCYIVHDKQ